MAERIDPEVMDQVRDFYRSLDADSSVAFDAAVEMLVENGPALRRPIVGEVVNDLIPHLRELRPLGTNIRVLFTFGPDRIPVLLYAGDKTGEWNRWYPGAIEEAARLYERYLREI